MPQIKLGCDLLSYHCITFALIAEESARTGNYIISIDIGVFNHRIFCGGLTFSHHPRLLIIWILDLLVTIFSLFTILLFNLHTT